MKLPYQEVRFTKKGALSAPSDRDAAIALVATTAATDVLVMSHGWNNTPAAARALYERLATSMDAVRDDVAGSRSRRLVVIGVIWPSIQWAPEEGSGAGADAETAEDVLRAEVVEKVSSRTARTRLLALVDRLESDPGAAEEFVEVLRATLPPSSAGEDAAAFTALRSASPAEIIDAARGIVTGDDADAGEVVGGAADIDPAGLTPLDSGGREAGGAGFFSSIVDAVRGVLNITTYYTMKHRAGLVGEEGIAPLLTALHAAHPDTSLHLIGHSFGGRAATAAAKATSAPVQTLTLLQAAYSHFGMAQNWDGAGADGLFAIVPSHVRGPIVVTCTRNDEAVGLAYPIASRLAQQIGVALGDENDPYGGIGRNGALKTPASLPRATLLEVGGAYDFQAGRVSSLVADAFISGHSDVTGRQVAYAILSALEA
ncbi:MAG: hypothetical protein QM622_08905 [Microbacterium sp.]